MGWSETYMHILLFTRQQGKKVIFAMEKMVGEIQIPLKAQWGREFMYTYCKLIFWLGTCKMLKDHKHLLTNPKKYLPEESNFWGIFKTNYNVQSISILVIHPKYRSAKQGYCGAPATCSASWRQRKKQMLKIISSYNVAHLHYLRGRYPHGGLTRKAFALVQLG